ncbi:DUF2985 domain-containing protein [Rubellimicrobium aerolatum]|uniref:DUF2985 domain-containing protein n=1 Tax=Rubellimicrobium aerolatum TaxID=490979 RepID=A0ABW0SE18_9RHOB|nr:hypothetical protein [Rubellimicrobium aerolatum]MBP1806972.1 hypothetical protein [Rubellimicrobium aerolatum]
MSRWRPLWRELRDAMAREDWVTRGLLVASALLTLYCVTQIPQRVVDVARLLGW